MYYVNIQQIEERLGFLPFLMQACEQLEQSWDASQTLLSLAQERVLHLAIETVTDVGSLLIDGFLLRDASSYEDIIEILIGEKVFPLKLGAPLLELVKFRRPLVQEYMALPRHSLHPLIPQLPTVLAEWGAAVAAYIAQEL
jgi:uncharacterized protein YutE (UPF0331/DUF86 family)